MSVSTEAQRIKDAFYRELPPDYEAGGLAAAFRELVDIVAPKDYASFNGNCEYDQGREAQNDSIRDHILDIIESLKK